jgi:hypothetical protein
VRFRLGQLFAAPLAAVEQAYFDPGVLERLEAPSVFGKMELLEQRADGELITQRVRYHFRGQLSAAVTAVVDARRLSWVEETVYDCGEHRGAITVIPDHYADRLSCRASVALAEVAGATATRREREGELSVHVPFVAGRVERAIVSGLEEHAALEERIVQQWLDEQTARRG